MAVPTSAQFRKKTLREVALGVSDGAAPVTAVPDVQTVTITGAPTGGWIPLTKDGQTTGHIAWNATAAVLQAALEALSTVGVGNVDVTGGPGPGTGWICTFTGDLAGPQSVMTSSAAGLTGGTTPAVAVAHTTPGVLGEPNIHYIVLDTAGVAVAPETQDLITQGTTQKYHDREKSSEVLTLDQQVVEDALMQIAHDSATSGLPGGVAKRYFDTGVVPAGDYELRLKYTMINQSDASVRTEFWRWPLCSLTAADAPANSQAETVVGSPYVFTSRKTSVDLAGNAIAGVPSGGTYSIVDVHE